MAKSPKPIDSNQAYWAEICPMGSGLALVRSMRESGPISKIWFMMLALIVLKKPPNENISTSKAPTLPCFPIVKAIAPLKTTRKERRSLAKLEKALKLNFVGSAAGSEVGDIGLVVTDTVA